jgi:hypothetical protein
MQKMGLWLHHVNEVIAQISDTIPKAVINWLEPTSPERRTFR